MILSLFVLWSKNLVGPSLSSPAFIESSGCCVSCVLTRCCDGGLWMNEWMNLNEWTKIDWRTVKCNGPVWSSDVIDTDRQTGFWLSVSRRDGLDWALWTLYVVRRSLGGAVVDRLQLFTPLAGWTVAASDPATPPQSSGAGLSIVTGSSAF